MEQGVYKRDSRERLGTQWRRKGLTEKHPGSTGIKTEISNGTSGG